MWIMTYAEKLFHTGWFVESLLTQTMIVHIIRTNRIPFVQSWPSLPLAMGTLVVMAIGAWLPYSMFAGSLKLVPLPLMFWGWMAVVLHGVRVPVPRGEDVVLSKIWR